MWKQFNNNPCGRDVGDCAIRAVSVVLGTNWEDAYVMLCDAGLAMCDMPHANSTVSAVLRKNGFYRSAIPNQCPDCYTICDFCMDHPTGIYVLGTGSHMVAVIDGNYYDSWDSGNEIPVYYHYIPTRER